MSRWEEMDRGIGWMDSWINKWVDACVCVRVVGR